ncbi:MAG: DUF4404 family protein [Chitinivibrionales bacterium]|nr:DUF4404 family protein [Chitinivibrionales bacterium]
MPHDIHNLNNSLQQLQSELTSIEQHTDESRRAASELLESIQPLLDNPGELSFEHHRILMRSMTEAFEQFELTHPRISTLLTSIIQSLQAVGI